MTIRCRHLVAIALLAAAGCGESVDSSSVSTDGIYADFSATADGSGQTRLHAGLKTGGPKSNTFLTLGKGDRLRFHARGESYEPKAIDILGQYEVYEHSLDGNEGGTECRIAFERRYAKSAPDSTVSLPKPFEIEGPSATDAFSRADDAIKVRLSNEAPDATHQLEVTGECLKGIYRLKFKGKIGTIDPGALDPADEENAPDKCSAQLTVTRRQSGDVDPAYDGGRFVATQKRVASFKSRP